MRALISASLPEDVESAYLTLLALHILKEAYADRADEHTLICMKAKLWLLGAGVAAYDLLIDAFTLDLVK